MVGILDGVGICWDRPHASAGPRAGQLEASWRQPARRPLAQRTEQTSWDWIKRFILFSLVSKVGVWARQRRGESPASGAGAGGGLQRGYRGRRRAGGELPPMGAGLPPVGAELPMMG